MNFHCDCNWKCLREIIACDSLVSLTQKDYPATLVRNVCNFDYNVDNSSVNVSSLDGKLINHDLSIILANNKFIKFSIDFDVFEGKNGALFLSFVYVERYWIQWKALIALLINSLNAFRKFICHFFSYWCNCCCCCVSIQHFIITALRFWLSVGVQFNKFHYSHWNYFQCWAVEWQFHK